MDILKIKDNVNVLLQRVASLKEDPDPSPAKEAETQGYLDQIAELESELKAVKGENEELKREKTELERQLQTAKTTIRTLKTELDRLRRKLNLKR